jgi:hypothetical protein
MYFWRKLYQAQAQHALNALKSMLSMAMLSMHLMTLSAWQALLSLRLKYKITNIRPKSHTHGCLECVKKKTQPQIPHAWALYTEIEFQGWDKRLFFVY